MLCCAVLILAIGFVKRTWLLVTGLRQPAEPGFAPPAQRPGPPSNPIRGTIGDRVS
jgi:hypothetical protein